MTIQSKTVFKVTFSLLIFCSHIIKSQQLALPKDVIASVDSHNILLNDFLQRYDDYLISSGVKDNITVRRSILSNMINEILLYYYDDNRRIFNDTEYQIEQEWAKKQTILAYLKDQEIYAKLTATEAEIRDAFYKSNVKVAARHLFAETEGEANGLYQLLQAGADFNQLAKQVFTDSTLANNGGYLGYFSWGDMDPSFEDAAYSLQIGEISKPVKTKYGYSIINVEERVPHPLLTENEFQKKKSHMERVVKIRKKRPAEIEFINAHFNPNNFWYDEKILGKIFNNLRYSTVNSIEDVKREDNYDLCATYNEKKYGINEIEKRISELPIFLREKINDLDVVKTVVKGFVIHDILYDIAINKGYDKNSQVLEKISKYESSIFLKYKRKEIHDNSVLPDSLVHKFYTENPSYFLTSPKLNVQEIIVKDRARADSILFQLNKGADFGQVAEKKSMREWTAKNKGFIGLSDLSKYGALKDTLWNSEVGKIVGPIKIENYYVILKIIEKRQSEVKQFESVMYDAMKLLKKEKSRQIVSDYLDKIKTRIKVNINEQLLKLTAVGVN